MPKNDFTFPFFVQLNFCTSATNEAPIILQWASTRRHSKAIYRSEIAILPAS